MLYVCCNCYVVTVMRNDLAQKKRLQPDDVLCRCRLVLQAVGTMYGRNHRPNHNTASVACMLWGHAYREA